MKEGRPRINIVLSGTDRILENAGFLLLILLWGLTLITYFKSPDIIPIHFSASGEADGFGNKLTLLVLPVIATVILIILTQLNKYPHIFNYPVDITDENAEKQYINATRMIRVLKVSIVLIFTIDILFTYLTTIHFSNGPGSWFLPLTIGLVFVPTVFYVIKSFRVK
jgi:uncharacterized membrane protein